MRVLRPVAVVRVGGAPVGVPVVVHRAADGQVVVAHVGGAQRALAVARPTEALPPYQVIQGAHPAVGGPGVHVGILAPEGHVAGVVHPDVVVAEHHRRRGGGAAVGPVEGGHVGQAHVAGAAGVPRLHVGRVERPQLRRHPGEVELSDPVPALLVEEDTPQVGAVQPREVARRRVWRRRRSGCGLTGGVGKGGVSDRQRQQ